MGCRKKDKLRRIDVPQKRKMSEIIWEFAGDCIRMGDTPEQKAEPSQRCAQCVEHRLQRTRVQEEEP